jgi:hypothetical protein
MLFAQPPAPQPQPQPAYPCDADGTDTVIWLSGPKSPHAPDISTKDINAACMDLRLFASCCQGLIEPIVSARHSLSAQSSRRLRHFYRAARFSGQSSSRKRACGRNHGCANTLQHETGCWTANPGCFRIACSAILLASTQQDRQTFGAVAQLGERRVRNAKVEGSTPFRSTRKIGVKDDPFFKRAEIGTVKAR